MVYNIIKGKGDVMPAYSTHYLFAYELMEKIKSNVDFPLDEQAVYIGTQGPDIFYDHRILPWMCGKSLRKVGSVLHRAKPSVQFDALRDYVNQHPDDDIAKSYAVGFILHYALDRVCHPYVYFMQYRFKELYPDIHTFTAHNMAEFALDSYLLFKKLGVQNPASFDTSKTLNYTDLTRTHCAKIISFFVSNSTENFVSQFDAKQAIDDLKYIQKVTFDPNDKICKVLKPAETFASPFTKNFKPSSMFRVDDMQYAAKFANNRHGIWYSPFNKSVARKESFADLFENAKPEALFMIQGFFENKDTFELTGDLSFLTGERVKYEA